MDPERPDEVTKPSERNTKIAEYNKKSKEEIKQLREKRDLLKQKKEENPAPSRDSSKSTKSTTDNFDWYKATAGGIILVVVGVIYFIQRGKEVQEEIPPPVKQEEKTVNPFEMD